MVLQYRPRPLLAFTLTARIGMNEQADPHADAQPDARPHDRAPWGGPDAGASSPPGSYVAGSRREGRKVMMSSLLPVGLRHVPVSSLNTVSSVAANPRNHRCRTRRGWWNGSAVRCPFDHDAV